MTKREILFEIEKGCLIQNAELSCIYNNDEIYFLIMKTRFKVEKVGTGMFKIYSEYKKRENFEYILTLV